MPAEIIHFNTPLTLIVGWNGSGKTTIIECLKYATTGELPPNSKTGGAFIHDPKLIGEKEIMAQVQLSFSLQLTIKKTTRIISTRVAELDQIVPQYLDDSLWPMSEPGTLKKKFDEIFEAQKYTKAIDNIKVLRKAKHDELEDRERGRRSEKRQEELLENIEARRDKFATMETEAKEAASKSTAAYDHAAKFEHIANQDSAATLEIDLQEMAESDEELQSMLEQYDDRLKQYAAQKQGLVQENRTALGQKQSQIGKYHAEKEQHDRQLQQRETLIKEAAKRHGIRGFDYEGIIGKMSREQDKTLSRARDDLQKELRDSQAGINQLTQRRSQIVSNDKRVAELQRTMDKISIDEGGEARLKEKKKDTEERLKSANSEADAERYEERIRDADAKLRTLDEKKEQLDAELFEATKLARESAQIDVAKDDLRETEKSLASMKEVHSNRISQLATFERVVAGRAAKVKEAESRRDVLSSIESEQKKKRVEFQKYEKIVKKAVQKDDLSDFEEALHYAKISAQLQYMQSCLQVAKEHNQCRLCKRTLRDDKADHFTKTGFIADLERIVSKAEQNAQAENTDDLLAELETARNAKPSFELAMRIKDKELPALQSELASLTAERDAINKQLEEQDSGIYDLRASKQDVEYLTKDVQKIVNDYNHSCELKNKIQGLTDKQKAAGLSRGIDAVQVDLKKVSDEIRSARSDLARLSADREKLRSKINALELSVRDVNADLNSAQSSLKEKRALAERIEEFRNTNNEQRAAIRNIDTDIQNLVPQIEQAQIKYADIDRRGSEHVQRLQEETTKLSDSVRQLKYTENEISAYIKKGGPKQLEKTQQEIEDFQSDLAQVEEEMVGVTRKINKINDTVGDADSTRRAINDNLRYRNAKRALQTLECDIQELEAHNAEEDKTRYEKEGSYWQTKRYNMESACSGVVAEMTALDNQLREMSDEWERNYKDAAKSYREAHIKVETTKAAVEDLGRYGGALDKAIMKYHTLKMEEINRIVEELWKSSYQGTDVDSIKIRSDNETGRGNRSYNYRVVMSKQDTEMDMRGRCSAGQKVLASIVIRLALAECFGTNCGLIALDEPTTNLDAQNIQGLAVALSQIIQYRRKQANFQLIVITHDEQFLKAMNCSDFADVYWRVDRNENQRSVIERQNIDEVLT
ncbi:DNA repair protein-like protein rad50 [Massariosphaeria phaeospora]|uniref:DNA repair protein-like protein rad50 n=1 Tax=Massariosphaeria phaeospora TaxID=100035 RepID=A0A7C8M6G6_9PLEO|nr:DNA repair protein-like protein rad50 [Massariosphaeria phaeospora]